MFSIDDRAGNVVTTVALFLAAAAILYLARGAFLHFAAVSSFCLLARTCGHVGTTAFAARQKNRTWAIAQVYLIGTLVLGGLGVRVRSAPCSATKKSECGCAQNLRRSFQRKNCRRSGSQAWLERGSAAADTGFVGSATMTSSPVFSSAVRRPQLMSPRALIWLFAIPILAIFILRDGRQMADAMIEAARIARGSNSGQANSAAGRYDACQVHSRAARPGGPLLRLL